MDDALSVRLREVNLGYRWYPVEGSRDIEELHAMSGVRPAQLAYHLSEDAERLGGRRIQAGVSRQELLLTAQRPNNGMHPTADTLLLKYLQRLWAAGDAGRYALRS
jgi:hypothetical protein